MNTQPLSISRYSKDELNSLSNNLAEAMEILFKSVAKRMVKEKIEKIKNEAYIKDEGAEYGKSNRI